MKKISDIKPYRLATLNDAKGDLSKRWCVIFYVWSEIEEKEVRKRQYLPSKHKTAKERRAYAYNLIAHINKLLENGYYIKKDGSESKDLKIKTEEKLILSISDAFHKILEVKEKNLRLKTFQKLKSISNIFIKFIRPKLYLHQLEPTDIIAYSDYLFTKRGIASVSRNDHIEKLKSLFNEMIAREWMETNPCEKIKKSITTQSSKNKAFSQEQRKLILSKADPQLTLTIKFIYYCFMRPNEVRLMKVEHIDLKTKKIFIPPNVAKNRKAQYVSIPKPLYDVLLELELSDCNGEHHLIGKTHFKDKNQSIEPSETPFSTNIMSKRHRNILKKIDLFDKDYTLYSWKHTGVVTAYKSGVDIKTIQYQCRHHSIQITDTYLKSLGLEKNQNAFDGMDEL